VDYIGQNYARQDFQVADLSQEFGLSRSQLYRKVNALLWQNKLTVAEIAYQVGYSSPDYFSTVFKSKYNIAPSQFKKGKNGGA
jgi:AraC-like DNA-binding protein